MVNRVVDTPRWRRWMPWWAGTYFVAAFAVASLTSEATVDDDGASTLFWLVQLPIALVAAWYCFRRARHCRAQAAVALGLGGAVYVGVVVSGSNAFGGVVMGLMASAGWYGATRILDRHRGLVPGWSDGPRRTLRLVGLGLVAGLLLGAINVIESILTGSAPQIQPAPQIVRALAGALQPAIIEEVTFRLFPLAWWIAARGALPTTRRGRTGLYAWLVLPWAATHVPDLVVTNPLEALYVVLLLIVVFGIPLAWLTARRGVQSAITAHWAVDAIAMGLS